MNYFDFLDELYQLDCPNGSRVYLVGTYHFSEHSIEQVRRTIASTHPDIVVLELCDDRKDILLHSEDEFLKDAETLTLAKVKGFISKDGLLAGIVESLYSLLLAQLTQDLGTAPGGEFRAGYEEALKINADVVLGDRLEKITCLRAIARLSFCDYAYLISIFIRALALHAENCRIDQMLLSKFPALTDVLIHERDKILTYSLMQSANCASQPFGPARTVVGIIGRGHVQGICTNWMKVEDVKQFLVVPTLSGISAWTRRLMKFGFKMWTFATFVFIVYGTGLLVQKLLIL